MSHSSQPFTSPRRLTDNESEVIRWLLGRAAPASNVMASQLDQLEVVGACTCGCASVDLALVGRDAPAPGGEIVSERMWRDEEGGLYMASLYRRAGSLSELDLWAVDAPEVAYRLPTVAQLERGDADGPEA